MVNHDHYAETARKLDRFDAVPDDVLCHVVTRDGLCFWVFDRDAMPELTGDGDSDRELAAALCAGCPVTNACLELELRTSGEETVGVWGGLAEDDRREVYRVWKRRHINRRTQAGEWW
ncbi:WhiB family transcriptional regulator [Saccharomonospora azurea]|uniref:Transcription factor WhiB n=1 Tax=Saccharomonospora azurea NA-128 TaxID=882081 RepID=H8GFR9_9PSEU|nr:WhiB family transcriptional regulator [Saccharomonospora azurea]EHY91104.1 Transcription factor WhiB [Saccharomonospora azurea NA-128]